MAWYTLVAIGIAAAAAVAILAPGLARAAVDLANQFQFVIYTVVGVLLAFYLLTSGVTLLVIIGVASVAIAFLRWDPLEML